nr:MAG TPA: hypothetical protein [Caudoviricetes sp.]DAR21671.1 MAG TPA: hypothetical protein [Caudoviricetes sp.]
MIDDLTATYHVARFAFCYIPSSKTALDHITDRGVALCGLRISVIKLLCIFLCGIIVTALCGCT